MFCAFYSHTVKVSFGLNLTKNYLNSNFSSFQGYHNYHHVFPWDYRASEFGGLLHFNVSTVLLDMWAKFGWVYDRKVVSQEMIDRRKARTGDGRDWLTFEASRKNPVWGYGDIDMDIDDRMDLHAQVDRVDLNGNLLKE